MKNQISESIFSGNSVIVPMADVQNIEKFYSNGKCINSNAPKKGALEQILVITKHTKWNFDHDTWENAICISNWNGEADKFIKAYCDFRYETDIKPTEC